MRTSRWLLVLALLAAACSGTDTADTAEVTGEASGDPTSTAGEPTEGAAAEEAEEDDEGEEEEEDEGSRDAAAGTQIIEAGQEPLPADNNNTDNCHDFRDESRTVPRPAEGQAVYLSGSATQLSGFEVDDLAILTISADGENRRYNIKGYQDDCRDTSAPTVVSGVNGRVQDAVNLSALAPAGSGDLTVRVEVKNGNGRGAASDMYLIVGPGGAGTSSTEPPAEPTEDDLAPPVEAEAVEKLRYSEDFTGGVVGSEWTYSDGEVTEPVVATAPNGELFLGGNAEGTEQLGSQTATLTLTAPSAGQIDVTFDFYRILSWDGNGPTGNGEDNFQVVLVQNGTEVVLVAETSFGHDAPGARGQAYPQPLGNTNPAETGQDADDTLGYVGTTGFAPTDDTGDGIYTFDSQQDDHSVLSDIAVEAGTFEIRFTGVTNQARADESWGLDNVTVTQQ